MGATNYHNALADYSNFGNHTELVAPVGDDNGPNDEKIWSTILKGKYTYGIGTSFAAPQVAAVIALMKSIKPTLSIEEIRTTLHETATDLGEGGRDDYYGYGLLNASAAVIATFNQLVTPPASLPIHPLITDEANFPVIGFVVMLFTLAGLSNLKKIKKKLRPKERK